MTMDRLFYGTMALAGAAAGALLVAVPASQDFVIKPYFWMLIAVGLFDAGLYVAGRSAAGAGLAMHARLIGFAAGMALMVAIPLLAGTPVRFF